VTAALRLPEGSCDCHFHVFDADRYPYAEGRHYTPADAPLADWLAMGVRFGIDRGVLVHPTVFGHDHRSFETILAAYPERLRGVAVVGPDTPDEDIARWHALGARGTRIVMTFGGGRDQAVLERIVAKVRPFGWHVQILVDLFDSPEVAASIAALGVPVVVDHMGHHAAAALATSAGYANLLTLLERGEAWVKLSAPYRLSPHSAGDADVSRLVAGFIRANPHRLLWGTDWPHPSSPHPVPDDERLMAQVFEWFADAALRETVLVQNPSRLYGFPGLQG
jgi:predicted TIM-barrel fold metal-dependent hydrolase